MRTISFFSAKGGTCKTTMNMLFASYLKYHLGKRVLVMDFDGPEYNLSYTRKRELLYCEKNGIAVETENLYPIHEVDDISENGLREILAFKTQLTQHYDYLVMDFPGSFAREDAVCRLALRGAFDLLVLPVELDGMIIASSRSLASTLQQMGQKTLLFFNKVHGKEKPEMYDALRKWFGQRNVRMSNHKVKNSLKMRRDSDAAINYCRSSITFPFKEIQEYNPGIIELFEEVIHYE